MNSSLLEEVKSAVKNWWVFLISGIFFIGLAILLMFYPTEGYETLIIVFSVCMFANGLFEILFAISNRKTLTGWGWYLTGGIVDWLMSVFLIGYPEVTALVIPMIMGFWIMFRGFATIGFSFDFKSYGIKGWGWYLVFGMLAVLCSVAIIWNPAAGALASVYMLSFAFMFLGFMRIMLSFDLRGLYNNSQKLKERLSQLGRFA